MPGSRKYKKLKRLKVEIKLRLAIFIFRAGSIISRRRWNRKPMSLAVRNFYMGELMDEYVNVYIYVYIYLHTYIHTYIRIHTCI